MQPDSRPSPAEVRALTTADSVRQGALASRWRLWRKQLLHLEPTTAASRHGTTASPQSAETRPQTPSQTRGQSTPLPAVPGTSLRVPWCTNPAFQLGEPGPLQCLGNLLRLYSIV